MASGGRQILPENARRWWRYGVAAVIGVLALAHLPFVVYGYGETDAALTAIVATLWAQDGQLPLESALFVEERFRSNPLYVHLIKSLLCAEWISRDQIAAAMNGFTALCGIVLPAAAFIVLRRLTSPAEAAIATVLILVSPVVFHSNCIGFCTIPSLLGFLFSVMTFQRFMDRPDRRYGWAALSAGLLILAVLTKVDVLLLSPCLVMTALIHGNLRRRKEAIALACVFPFVGVFVWHVYCQAVAPNASDTVSAFQSWSKQWPLYPAGLYSGLNLTNVVMAPGIGTAAAFGLGVVVCLLHKAWRSAVLAILGCILPTLLFWGMQEINSSRHNLWIVIPVAAFVSFVLYRLLKRTWLILLVLAGIGAGNYLLGPTIPTQFNASAHWFQAASARKQVLAAIHRDFALATRQFVPNGKLCCYRNPSGPWIAAVAVANSDRSSIKRSGPKQSVWHIEMTIRSKSKIIWVPNALDRSRETWNKIHDEGWTAIVWRNGVPPFFRIYRTGKRVPWPETGRWQP